MPRLRFGLDGLAIFASAVLLSTTVGHSQVRPDWLPTNLSAVDRGVLPVGKRVDTLIAQHRAHAGDRVGQIGAAYVPGRVIVKFRNGISPAARSSALARVSRTASIARVARRPGSFDLVTIGPGEDPESVAAALSQRTDVEYAQAAYRVYPYEAPSFVPDDPLYAKYQWNFPAIDLERAWAIQPGASPSIIIAIVDSGIAFQSGTLTRTAHAFCSTDKFLDSCAPGGGTSYPALGTITIPFARATDLATSDSRFVAPYDFIWNSTLPLDLEGHGTHVAGTAAELTNNGFGLAGIAFNARLMPVKVLDSDWDDIFRSPNVGTDDVVAQGITYAADNGAKVINLSIGRFGPSNCGTAPAAGCAPGVEAAIRYAVSKGCFVSIAAGNDGTDLPPGVVEVYSEIASRVQGAVAVAALNRKNGHASYSTVGSYVELSAPGGDSPDFVVQETYDFDFTDTFDNPVAQYTAPRFDVLGGVGYEGTSMAAPHVAGVAALLMSQGITSPAAIEAALEQTATPCSVTQDICRADIAPNQNDQFGHGEINARNAIRGLGLAK